MSSGKIEKTTYFYWKEFSVPLEIPPGELHDALIADAIRRRDKCLKNLLEDLFKSCASMEKNQ